MSCWDVQTVFPRIRGIRQRFRLALSVLLPVVGGCNPVDCPPPEVLSVAPETISSLDETLLTISGRNLCLKVFADFTRSDGIAVHGDFTARLVGGGRDSPYHLVDVHQQDSTTLTAIVEPGCVAATFAIEITDPWDRTAIREQALTVLGGPIGVGCTTNDECQNDPCVTNQHCTDGLCVYDKDTDGDGHIDASCGGDDCDDDPTSCGSGCFPDNPALDLCDGHDQDCNGIMDEDFVGDSSCGVGYCRETNTPSSCEAGVETPCQTGTPSSADDTTCDGVDDNCSGDNDEDYVSDDTCGVGYCRTYNTPSSCTGGVETSCQPGTPVTSDDTTCDGVDDDCSGDNDEDYVADDTCGVGYCQTTNTPSTCIGGQETPCVPGTPLSADDNCDGVDDNCDGIADEGAGGSQTYYHDADGDGFTRTEDNVIACTDPDGAGINWVDAATLDDCDDTDPAVFHGSACDDGESCTDGDTCTHGICAGYPTSACGDCSGDCNGTCSAEGCCVETCSTGSCPDCDAGCACDLTCTDGEYCSTTCNTGSVCNFVTTDDKFDTSLGCNDSTCNLECINTKKDCNLACAGGSVCVMTCVGGQKNCVTNCADSSSCTMTCDSNLKDCQIDVQDGATGLITCINVGKDCIVNCTAKTDCGGGVWACNLPCP